MKTPNRDLLVLMKEDLLSEEEMEVELLRLNDLLLHYETVETFCYAHEIIDLNKFKVINKFNVIQRIIREKETKAFVFICNKN